MHLGGSHYRPIILTFPGVQIKYGKFLANKKLFKSLNEIDLSTDVKDIMSTFKEEIGDATYEINNNKTPKFWWHDGLNVLF